jgi:homospermidine synthase
MKKNVVIIGAGAIGRGYLPLVLNNDKYNFVFIDQNLKILNLLKKKYYFSYKIKNDLYEKKKFLFLIRRHQKAQKQEELIRLYFQHLNPKVDSNIKSKLPNFKPI